MLINAKALVVVLMLALAAFQLCKPLCLRFMDASDFVRRRNVWLALSTVAFLSPSFWIYAVFAIVVLTWAGSRDRNPLALYILMFFTVPDVYFDIPAPVINQFFGLSQHRILSLFVLIPALLRSTDKSSLERRGMRAADWLVAAFWLIQLVLLSPHESATNAMRRAFLMFIDIFLVFYVFARIANRERLAEVIAAFWLCCALMAPMAVFESMRSWLLYTNLTLEWGNPTLFAWLLRGNTLRAQVAANHSINLGYHLAMGLGAYLYLRSRWRSGPADWIVLLTMTSALILSQSRGAWVTLAIVVAVFLSTRPNAARHGVSALLVIAGAMAVMYVTPLKESVLDRLPFIGTADQGTIEYRQRLLETSWTLIQQNPFFGDPFVYLRMESLRQGQGIIDIVNGYVFAALFTGLVGAAFMTSAYLLGLLQGWRAFVATRSSDPDGALMGAALLGCLVGTMFYIATAGYGPTTYIVCALTISFACTAVRRPIATPAGIGRSEHQQPRPAV